MNLFIGCSSREDIPLKYYEDCKLLLEILLKENSLVFGAYHGGIMGLAHDISLNFNQEIIGICPQKYIHDLNDLKCTKEIITNTVNQRTDSLIENSDILIFLPGGIGTVYELFTALECKRCHEFDKPIIIYNSNGFFNNLLNFLEVIYKEQFASDKDKNLYFVSKSTTEIINFVENYKKKKLTLKK